MQQEKIIDKICKCLRLSESCNPNEAASALRQAQRLMQKYRINDVQISASLVNEKAIQTELAKAPPFWVLALVNLVADAFDCRGFVDRQNGLRSEFRFIGVASAPEVATYLFTILLRKLTQARQAFLEELEDGLPEEHERRVEVFTQAWLFRVAQTVKTFIGMPQVRETVDVYVKSKYGEIADASAEHGCVESNKRDYEDILCGMRAAHAVSLFSPLADKQLATICLESMT